MSRLFDALRRGLSLQEAKQILHVNDGDLSDTEKLNAQFDRLFTQNDKSKGGSFYLQSKIYRAKERIDQELRESAADPKNSKRNKQREDPSDASPS